MNIIERLDERIISVAFAAGAITDGQFAERLIRERRDAIDAINTEFNNGLEAAALEIEQCNRDGPYEAIRGATRIRALKRSPCPAK